MKKGFQQDEFKLTVDSNIMEVVRRYPGSVEIFMKYGLPCIGCAAAQYEKISDVAPEFGIDANVLIREIKRSGKDEK